MTSEDRMYEFIKEKEIEKIVLEHGLNSKKIEDHSKELIRHSFEQAIAIILLQVKQYIESANRFKLIESIYGEMVDLKKAYIEYARLPYASEAIDESAKEDLAGIFKTIYTSIEAFPSEEENPIEYERILIISTGLLKIKEMMNGILNQVEYDFRLPTSLTFDVKDLITDYLINRIRHSYKALTPLIHQIIEELNTYDKRIALKGYMKFIDDQLLLVGAFINFRLEIANQDNQHLTDKYIVPLKAFVSRLKEMQGVKDHCLSYEDPLQDLNISNVDEIITGNLNKEETIIHLFTQIEDLKRTTIERAILHINTELAKATTSVINKLKKDSGRFELLSSFVIELFEETLQCLASHDVTGLEEGIENKIIKGVEDTIHLKYDTLKDKDEDYHMSKKEDYLVIGEGFIDYRNNFEQNCENYLEEAVKGGYDSFVNSQALFNKMVARVNESNLKKDLDYLKKDMLLETKTLEDLTHHSIDRLKVSDNQVCHEFAECIDGLYERILVQLKRSDIIQIKPKPHDSFNGKIHEVLMTESLEGFEKGQIIKAQNSGFIFGSQILQRASVIVSK